MKKLFLVFISIFLIYFNSLAQDYNNELRKMDETIVLSSFIKNQGYKYLEFKPELIDSIANNKVSMSHNHTNSVDIIRCKSSIIAKEPIIILNQYHVIDWQIIEAISLKDIKSLNLYKPDNKITTLYGTSGRYGVIIIEIKKKVLRKLKRKFGKSLGN